MEDGNDLVLRFIPFGGSCDGDEEVSSPRFSIEAAPASIPTPTPTSHSTTASASSLSKNTTTSSAAPSTTMTDTFTASASPTAAGLSTGAKAGIGVGVGLAAVLLLSALLLVIKVRKSREHAQGWLNQRTNPEKEITSRHTGPYHDGPRQGSGWTASHESSALAKKPGGIQAAQPVQELDGRDVILEVDGGRYGR